jgi:hypothetical protein
MGAVFGQIGRWRASARVAKAVELACLVPAFVLLAAGLATWGGHFWLSHELQLVADHALAAASGELNLDSRESRARVEAEEAIAERAGLSAGLMRLSVVSTPRRLTVLLVYDASRTPMFALGRLLPGPSPVIVRSASGDVAPV